METDGTSWEIVRGPTVVWEDDNHERPRAPSLESLDEDGVVMRVRLGEEYRDVKAVSSGVNRYVHGGDASLQAAHSSRGGWPEAPL